MPVRWKQFLITWSAIYPLALGVPLMVVPVGGSGFASVECARQPFFHHAISHGDRGFSYGLYRYAPLHEVSQTVAIQLTQSLRFHFAPQRSNQWCYCLKAKTGDGEAY